MVEIVRSKKLAYFPIRKVGGTSIRRALEQVSEGPHDYIRTSARPLNAKHIRMTRGMHRIAIVRDPVERFLSAYSHRIHDTNDLDAQFQDRWITRLFGLPLRPDIDTFCRHFRTYYIINDKIRRHFRYQRIYLGPDLGFYQKIYRLKNLQELSDDLSEIAGKAIEIPHLMVSGRKLRFEDCSAYVQKFVLDHTRQDYDALSDYFTPPEPTH